MLSRRALIPAAVLVLASPGLPRAQTGQPAPQDHAAIDRVETYLNGISTLKARFNQVAGNGGVSQGTVWLQRPGRLRFQYDPPAPFLLVAAHGVLTFNDSALQQTSNVSLGRTPLGILLGEHVTLSGAVTVTSVQQLPGQLQLTVVRTQSPGDGSLTLVFSVPPLALRQWTVVDAQQRTTHIALSDIQTGLRFNPRLFEQLAMPAADLAAGD